MPEPKTPNHFRTYSHRERVEKAEGKELHKPTTAYEFSKGRKFDDPGKNGGAYNLPVLCTGTGRSSVVGYSVSGCWVAGNG